jgi:ATP synthase protein I
MSEQYVSPSVPDEEDRAVTPPDLDLPPVVLPGPLPPVHDRMLRQVETKESRKLRAREEGTQSAWFGLGMFGMVGWSVAVPTVLGVLLGVWIDSNYPGRYSWTLMLLLAGLALGCFSAWRWVSREREQIDRRERKDRHDH